MGRSRKKEVGVGLGLQLGLEMIWCQDGHEVKVKSLDEFGFGFGFGIVLVNKNEVMPWLVWLRELSASLQTKERVVQFPVRAYAWVAGQVPSRGRMRGSHISKFLSLCFSLPSLLSKIK